MFNVQEEEEKKVDDDDVDDEKERRRQIGFRGTSKPKVMRDNFFAEEAKEEVYVA